MRQEAHTMYCRSNTGGNGNAVHGGELITETLENDSGRQVDCVPPAGSAPRQSYSSLTQLIAPWGGVLDAADAPSTMIVDVHRLDDERLGLHESRTVRGHEKFFVEDVGVRARSRSSGTLRCDFCASPGGYRPPDMMLNSMPRTYLVAGTGEHFFLENATWCATAPRDAGVDIVKGERVGSHATCSGEKKKFH